MRRTIFALTVFLAPTAVMASIAGGEMVGYSELGVTGAGIEKRQITGERGSLGGNVILAKGDMSGDGPGLGGQKGKKRGGNKGKQEVGKDNPNRQKGKR